MFCIFPDDHMQLIAALTNGKIVVLNFLLANSHSNQSQPITADAAGQRMKELLHAINNVSARMNQLSIISTRQDKVIEELNKACHLAGQLLGGHFESHDASVLQTQVQCVYQDEGSQCHVSLQCKVTNRTSFLLSRGWSLIVCVRGQQDWPVEDSGKSCMQLTKTVQLKDFEPGKTSTVCVSLEAMIYPLQLPLEMRCHLYFNLSDFVSNISGKHGTRHNNESNGTELNESGAVLTFACKTVDILMMLRSVRSNLQRQQQAEENSIQTTCNTGYDWLAKSLQEAASGRPLSNRKRPNEKEKPDGPVSTKVMFKGEIVEALKKDTSLEKGKGQFQNSAAGWSGGSFQFQQGYSSKQWQPPRTGWNRWSTGGWIWKSPL